MTPLARRWLGRFALAAALAPFFPALRPARAQPLRTADEGAANPALIERLQPRYSAEDQVQAFETLRPILLSSESAGLALTVATRWLQLEPRIRRKALALVPASASLTDALLKGLAAGQIPSWTLRSRERGGDVFQSTQNPRLRSAARQAFSAERQTVQSIIRPFVAELNTPAVREDGQAIFESLCSNCHRLRGRYNGMIGPDLSDAHRQSAMDLATNILVPSHSIADGFEVYTIETRTGQRHVGAIRSNDPAHLILQWNGDTIVLRRDEIVTLSLLPESLMPKDLRYLMTPVELRDLIGFLTALPPSSGRLPRHPVNGGA